MSPEKNVCFFPHLIDVNITAEFVPQYKERKEFLTLKETTTCYQAIRKNRQCKVHLLVKLVVFYVTVMILVGVRHKILITRYAGSLESAPCTRGRLGGIGGRTSRAKVGVRERQ